MTYNVAQASTICSLHTTITQHHAARNTQGRELHIETGGGMVTRVSRPLPLIARAAEGDAAVGEHDASRPLGAGRDWRRAGEISFRPRGRGRKLGGYWTAVLGVTALRFRAWGR